MGPFLCNNSLADRPSFFRFINVLTHLSVIPMMLAISLAVLPFSIKSHITSIGGFGISCFL